jgi:hypothetical protein
VTNKYSLPRKMGFDNSAAPPRSFSAIPYSRRIGQVLRRTVRGKTGGRINPNQDVVRRTELFHGCNVGATSWGQYLESKGPLKGASAMGLGRV